MSRSRGAAPALRAPSRSVGGDLAALLDQARLEQSEQVGQVDGLAIEAQRIEAAGRELRDEVRIRDLHAAHADEVELAGDEAADQLGEVCGETQCGVGAVE